MTDEERRLIQDCKVMIVGSGDFIAYVQEELIKIGFEAIKRITSESSILVTFKRGILIENINHSSLDTGKRESIGIPVLYPFDFISGAGVIVVSPENDYDFIQKTNLRSWAAHYMAGYSSFWKMADADWLHGAIPEIEEGKNCMGAQKTAALMCARIAANIAVGREVKFYPRFYLSKNL